MPTESRFEDLDLRVEPARDEPDRRPVLGSSYVTEGCGATVRCTRVCCTCSPG